MRQEPKQTTDEVKPLDALAVRPVVETAAPDGVTICDWKHGKHRPGCCNGCEAEARNPMKEVVTARRVWIDMGTAERQRFAEMFSIKDDLFIVPFCDLPTEMRAYIQAKADEANSIPAPVIVTPQIGRLSVR